MSGINKLIQDNAEYLLGWVPEIIGVFILVCILYFILLRYVFSPIVGIMRERERRIASVNDDEKSAILRYENLLTKYENAVKDARAEALHIRNIARENTARECAIIIEGARFEAETVLKNAISDLQLEVERAKVAMERESHELAEALVARILVRQDGL